MIKLYHCFYAFALLTFTSFSVLAQAPTLTKMTPVEGPIGTLVTFGGTNLGNPTSVIIGDQEELVISSTAKSVEALVMPGTLSGAAYISTAAGTSGSAVFLWTDPIYPDTQQGKKLVGTGSVGTSVSQGYSVAISANGNTAIVGAPYDNNNIGAAWIFVRKGKTWTQQGAKLVGTGATGQSQQGLSVAISANGNTAIVGGIGTTDGKGTAWVFERTDTTWKQQGAKLAATGSGKSAALGWAVALSANGNTALVGGVDGTNTNGAAWVFTRTANKWTQMGSKLVGTGITSLAYFGMSVALSADGNTASIGRQGDDLGLGAIWIFVNNDNTWTQQGSKLVGTGSPSVSYQGSRVALAADGNTAITGGIGDGQGVAWVYSRTGTTWTQQAVLLGTAGTGASEENIAVSISADGNTALVGVLSDDAETGATWVFKRTNNTFWTQLEGKLVGTGATGSGAQGWSVALSADASTAIIGGPYDNNSMGAAWIFAPANDSLIPARSQVVNKSYKDGDVATSQPVDVSAPLNISVYPNPYTGQFHLNMISGSTDNINVKIYDLSGRILDERNDIAFVNDLVFGNSYSAGVYVVQVQQGNMNKVVRVVKTE